MSNLEPFSSHPFLRPFSFEEWDHKIFDYLPLDFAQKWIDECEAEAEAFAESGLFENAAELRERAAWWAGLRQMPDQEGEQTESAAWNNATKSIDALLERSIGSDHATIRLMMLAEQIFAGLCQIAMHDNPKTAKSLVNSLSYIVDGFNDLARHKPEAFLHVTRRNQGIPGIITKFSEKTKQNEELVKLLEVGDAHPRQFPTAKSGKKGNKMSVSKTPANFWADSFYFYLYHAKIALEYFQERGFALPAQCPTWWHDAVALPPFSPKTWSKWADAAWKVVNEVTNGCPEQKPALFALQSLPKEKESKYSAAKHATTAKAYRRAIREALAKGMCKTAGG